MSIVKGQPPVPPSGGHHRSRNSMHLAFLVVAVLLVATVWILNILGSIPGLWSGIFSAFFTVLGGLLALIPFLSSSRRPAVQPSATLVVTPSLPDLPEGVILNTNDQRGSLIVYVRRSLRGSTIALCSGFSRVDLKAYAASSVVARRISRPFPLRMLGLRSVVFVAFFSSLEPGNYTVYTESREFIASVTIHAGQVMEIDWR